MRHDFERVWVKSELLAQLRDRARELGGTERTQANRVEGWIGAAIIALLQTPAPKGLRREPPPRLAQAPNVERPSKGVGERCYRCRRLAVVEVQSYVVSGTDEPSWVPACQVHR